MSKKITKRGRYMMKVLMLNGSLRTKGNTFIALEEMKKGILLLFVVLMGFTSCGKKFGHRYLDGMWQMQRIEYKDGNIDTPLDTYFSFQMDIIHLRKLGNSEFYGKYVYENDSMHIQVLDATAEQMKVFGMDGRVQDFAVEKLNSNKLVLQSDYARLEFRKY